MYLLHAMYGILTIARYPKYLGFAGFMSMAIFRLPLWLNKKIHFWKLMGCGRNGTFDKTPDWRQWAVLQVTGTGAISGALDSLDKAPLHPPFMVKYWRFFHAEVYTLVLEPLEGHGLWDGNAVFGSLPKSSGYNGPVAVLTRATIRLSRLQQFWQNVQGVANQMKTAPGFVYSVGIGEVPFIKQATFSVWQSADLMKQFAYQMQQHKEVVRKTRQQQWYSEEMFTRFKVLAVYGSINGVNPLQSFVKAV